MKKTILSVLGLTLTLLLLLSGCNITIEPIGDTTAPDTTEPGTAAPDSQTPDTTAPADTTATPADTEPVKKTEYDESVVILADTFEYEARSEFEGLYADENGKPILNYFKIPALSLSTPNAKAFNEKLRAHSSAERADCESNPVSGKLYYFDYEVGVRDNVLSILTVDTHGAFPGGANTLYDAYYYDLEADRELTFSEYLGKFGFTEQSFAAKFVASREFLTFSGFEGDPPALSAFQDPADNENRITAALFGKGDDAMAVFCSSATFMPVPYCITFPLF